MVTLKTSLEANYDTGRTDGHRTEKATYRGTSYRSAQKIPILLDYIHRIEMVIHRIEMMIHRIEMVIHRIQMVIHMMGMV